MSATAEVHAAHIVEVDAGRAPVTFVRAMRIGNSPKRVTVVLTQVSATVYVQEEGSPLVSGRQAAEVFLDG